MKFSISNVCAPGSSKYVPVVVNSKLPCKFKHLLIGFGLAALGVVFTAQGAFRYGAEVHYDAIDEALEESKKYVSETDGAAEEEQKTENQ